MTALDRTSKIITGIRGPVHCRGNGLWMSHVHETLVITKVMAVDQESWMIVNDSQAALKLQEYHLCAGCNEEQTQTGQGRPLGELCSMRMCGSGITLHTQCVEPTPITRKEKALVRWENQLYRPCSRFPDLLFGVREQRRKLKSPSFQYGSSSLSRRNRQAT